jgi:UDP-N-acetylglucosamine 4,6-dehydratase
MATFHSITPDMLNLLEREKDLFEEDMGKIEKEIRDIVKHSSFLVIGGGGSIGQQVVKEIFVRDPKILHVVDINENNLTELVRDIRSSAGYISGEFATFVLDAGSIEYDAFIENKGKYDYVLNLSAVKHVRSEKDPFTLMRMIDVNILNIDKTLAQSSRKGTIKYFCVSTDKAANPVNMMGASKRIMEMFLIKRSLEITVSTARFANVAFSDGSLLYGFTQRIQKQQPFSAPMDVKRYFMTPKESGELCLMSCLFGENRDIFFPKLTERMRPMTFSDIAVKYLKMLGYEPHICATEEEARQLSYTLPDNGKWPCYFFMSDTTGEKDIEEFYTSSDAIDYKKYESIGIIRNKAVVDNDKLDMFMRSVGLMKKNMKWTKQEIVNLFYELSPEFKHQETGKYLDGKM